MECTTSKTARSLLSATAAQLRFDDRVLTESELRLWDVRTGQCLRTLQGLASPCALECKWLKTVSFDDIDGKTMDRYVVFGHVVGVYIDDAFIKNGRLDTAAMKPIARLGYDEYAVIDSVFKMTRPKGGG